MRFSILAVALLLVSNIDSTCARKKRENAVTKRNTGPKKSFLRTRRATIASIAELREEEVRGGKREGEDKGGKKQKRTEGEKEKIEGEKLSLLKEKLIELENEGDIAEATRYANKIAKVEARLAEKEAEAVLTETEILPAIQMQSLSEKIAKSTTPAPKKSSEKGTPEPKAFSEKGTPAPKKEKKADSDSKSTKAPAKMKKGLFSHGDGEE